MFERLSVKGSKEGDCVYLVNYQISSITRSAQPVGAFYNTAMPENRR